MCYDEDRINGVYLSLHRRDDSNSLPPRKPIMPPQQPVINQQPYMHSAPHPSQGVPLQPSSLPNQMPYSQSDFIQHSRYPQNVIRSGPQYSSPAYDSRRLPLNDLSKRPRTGSQSAPSYGYSQSPLTKTPPAMQRSVSPALNPPFPHDSQGLYMQQRPSNYGVAPSQRPSSLPSPGGFPNGPAQGFQRPANSMSEVRRTQVAACRRAREVRRSGDGADDAARHAAADKGDGGNGGER